MRRALEVLRAVKAMGAQGKAASPVQLPTPPAQNVVQKEPAPPFPPPAPSVPSPAEVSPPWPGPGGDLAQALVLLDRAADNMVQSGQDVKQAVAILRTLQLQ